MSWNHSEAKKSLKEFGAFLDRPIFFLGSVAWGCLGTTRRPKNFQIDHFFNRKFKEFGTFPDRPISLRGPAARSRNHFESLGTTRRSKSLQIHRFFNRKLKGIRHLSRPADFFAFLTCTCHACNRCKTCWAIQACERLPGCELLVGFAVGIMNRKFTAIPHLSMLANFAPRFGGEIPKSLWKQ